MEQVMIRLSHGYFEGGVFPLPQTSPTIDAHIACWHILIGEVKEMTLQQMAKWKSHRNPLESACVTESICPTITTRIAESIGGGTNASTVLYSEELHETENIRHMYMDNALAYDEQNGYIRTDGTVGTLTTDGSSPKHNNRVVEFEPLVWDGFNQQVRTDSSTSGTIKNVRVRKLTEKECFRLQGVTDEDFACVRANQSKSSCYHLAGDSITTTVMMALFGEMLDLDWKEKVEQVISNIQDK
jgi:site-specific DNA-cytosine methylase